MKIYTKEEDESFMWTLKDKYDQLNNMPESDT